MGKAKRLTLSEVERWDVWLEHVPPKVKNALCRLIWERRADFPCEESEIHEWIDRDPLDYYGFQFSISGPSWMDWVRVCLRSSRLDDHPPIASGTYLRLWRNLSGEVPPDVDCQVEWLGRSGRHLRTVIEWIDESGALVSKFPPWIPPWESEDEPVDEGGEDEDRVIVAKSARVTLFHPIGAFIDGKEAPITAAQHRTIRALIEAGKRLSAKELDKATGASDSRKHLSNLKKLAVWKSVLLIPNKNDTGYGVL